MNRRIWSSKLGGKSPRAGRVAFGTAAACAIAWALVVVPARLDAQAPNPGTPTPEFAPNELIVRLRDGGSTARLASLLARLGAIEVKTFQTVDGLHVIKLPASLGVASAAQVAKTLDGVAYAEPNYIVKTQTTIPNDPMFASLWGLHNTAHPGADVHAPEAWDITTGSSSVVVAMIDTGIDYNHEDLIANMFHNDAECSGTPGVDDDGNGYIDDCYGIDTLNHDSDPFDDNKHGTHTAGTVGAEGNNSLGVVGVNWNVKLMPCKFLGATGSGSTADAVTCLDYVALMKDRGVNIVATNNSWAGGGFSQALYDAIDAQRQRGILFIAAAGNGGSDEIGDNNDVTPIYPASYDLPNVIAVAATTETDGLAGFSNYGRRSVYVGAPGSGILSTTPGNAYLSFSGTSMATPHVAGVAALLEAQDPSRDWRAIKNLILAGGDNDANLSNTITGKRLNAYGSLACSNQTVFSRLKPVQSAVTTTVGAAVTLSALNINCAVGAGNITVSASDGQAVLLKDDGVAPDQFAGDGIYSGWFAPFAIGPVVLTFPDSDTVTVIGLAPTSYAVQSTAFNYRDIGAGTNLFLGDDTSAAIASPFPISFGGVAFTTLFVSSNGMLNFTGAYDEYFNASIPTTQTSHLIAPFWDDLVAGTAFNSNVFWAVTGAAPNRELVVEWRNVTGFQLFTNAHCDSAENITFQAVFFEGLGDILFNYADTTFETSGSSSCSFRDGGRSATIGIQSSPSVGTLYSFNSASVSAGTALLWTLPPPGSFTDDPLIAGVLIKAVHITELRFRIDALRTKFGRPAMTWTDPTIIAGVTALAAQHLIELRSALVEAYQAAGQSPPSFADSPVQPGQTAIRAAQITELREAVKALQAGQASASK